MVLDERMGISGPQPTGKPLFYQREVLPDSAINNHGHEVLAAVLDNDGVAAPVGHLDARFIGRLQDEHVLTLAFPEPLDSTAGQAVLVIDGWVEYPYSQTNFAAWQAGAGYAAPSLYAAAGEGEWQLVFRGVRLSCGYAAAHVPAPVGIARGYGQITLANQHADLLGPDRGGFCRALARAYKAGFAPARRHAQKDGLCQAQQLRSISATL